MFYVTITRIETFKIDVESLEEALNLALEWAGPEDAKMPPEIIEHSHQTTNHEVEETL